jgi:hypothetical protein
MARARNIKPGFFKNEDLTDLPYEARLLFIGLWTLADREGRLEDRPKRIKGEIFPFDSVTVGSTNELLDKLNELGFIARYKAEGHDCIQVLKFNKHQNPHKYEKESILPPMPCCPSRMHTQCKDGRSTIQAQEKHDAKTVEAQGKDGFNTVLDGLIPDSLIPDSLSSENLGGGHQEIQTLQTEPPATPPWEPYEGNVNSSNEKFKRLADVYPNKRDIDEARKVWRGLLEFHSLIDRMVETVTAWSKGEEWQRDDGRYVPLLSTWLRKKRWEDPHPPAAKPGKSRDSPGKSFEDIEYESLRKEAEQRQTKRTKEP